MRMNNVLRDPDPAPAPGGGGPAPTPTPPAPTDWRTSIPEDIRNEPSLSTIKDIPSLAKSYVNAQRLIGADKVVVPKPGAPQAQWDEFYNKIGRPDVPDKYELPKDLKLHEGLKFDDEKLKEIKGNFHKMGLTAAQGQQLLKMYAETQSGSLSLLDQQREAEKNSAALAIKELYGDQADHRLDLAKGVIKKFGGDEVFQHLEKTGLGNNVGMVKMLVAIGDLMQEDHARSGTGGLIVADATQALAEIGQLKSDREFQAALHTANAPGHAEAVERWMNLFKVVYPGKQDS